MARTDSEGDQFIAIHEIYYEDDEPILYTAEPILMGWIFEDDTYESANAQMEEVLADIKKACLLPVLKEEDFLRGEE